MKLTYEILENIIIAIDEDGKQWFIPKDEANSDYQAYLESLKKDK